MIRALARRIRLARLHRMRRVNPDRHLSVVCSRLEDGLGQPLEWHKEHAHG